ncbi:xanthine dehydrogenase [Lacrimispora amygdalina]|uniref:Xanthine dehydrogenase n=1 Tax=Lacrimispora amygdalina TaxID=253257 RepID=A0A3E2N8T2_9FIRM|nr:XdhC family protein [Clostridium indicum]RFZ77413.1 xanthine dehydrogenase [Clostridium indicum]
MLELYRAIADCNPNSKNMVASVLDGEAFGQKALFSDETLICETNESGYFSEHGEVVLKAAGDKDQCRKGLITLDGSRIFCDWLGQEIHLVICGAGHVSIPVIQIGRMMGCDVTVLEDRPQFADNARRAGAEKVICEPFEQGLRQVEGGSNTYFIIVTRGHRYDQTCLELIAGKKHAYIGMIGSRLRVAKVKEAALLNGCDKAVIEQVYSPIGLNINAETPVEIGVSIMAEIIEVKNKKMRLSGYSKDILHTILNPEEKAGRNVLVTIVARKGSAPRDVGTKMLVTPDGRCIGTIGGGCMESEVIQKALHMLHSEDEKILLSHVDMTGVDAEEEGMVCGGVIDVLLEVV